ncbi:MAG: ABC-2 type transport system ATP-binding protein [Pirellulaceae bacterium]
MVEIACDKGGVVKQLSTNASAVAILDSVSKWYGSVIAVNGVSVELTPGITGLVGANGAGKSSFIRLLTGQTRPSLGHVSICGRNAWGALAKSHVGYCPDVDAFYEEMSGAKFVKTIALFRGYSKTEAAERCERVLEEVGMTTRADRPLKTYSKGMRQRIKLAQAILHEPDLIVLDEPLNGVDPIGRRELIELFQRFADSGKCVLVSSHILDEMDKLADRVLFMSRGRLLASGSLGEVRELLSDFPQKIHVETDRAREFAAAVVQLDCVLGVRIEGERNVFLEIVHPKSFFQAMQTLVIERKFDVRRMQTTDTSSESVFQYLLERARQFWIRGQAS